MAAVIVSYLITTRKLLLISSELADSHILSPALVAHPGYQLYRGRSRVLPPDIGGNFFC